jgi:hypothetical protein
MNLQLRLWLLPALIAIAASGCKARLADPATYEKTMLKFGSGGGFTGAVTEYCLLDNGQVFVKRSLEGAYEPVQTVSKKTARALMAQAAAPELAGLSFSRPGNMYSFIELPGGSGPNRIAWAQGDDKLPEAARSLYSALMALTSVSQ